jgi:hypothetical protein
MMAAILSRPEATRADSEKPLVAAPGSAAHGRAGQGGPGPVTGRLHGRPRRPWPGRPPAGPQAEPRSPPSPSRGLQVRLGVPCARPRPCPPQRARRTGSPPRSPGKQKPTGVAQAPPPPPAPHPPDLSLSLSRSLSLSLPLSWGRPALRRQAWSASERCCGEGLWCRFRKVGLGRQKKTAFANTGFSRGHSAGIPICQACPWTQTGSRGQGYGDRNGLADGPTGH